MQSGRRLPAATRNLESIRNYAEEQLARLPEIIADIHPADPPYPVEISPGLAGLQRRIRETLLKQ
jgi:nicotinate phosphoribosyltransferase